MKVRTTFVDMIQGLNELKVVESIVVKKKAFLQQIAKLMIWLSFAVKLRQMYLFLALIPPLIYVTCGSQTLVIGTKGW